MITRLTPITRSMRPALPRALALATAMLTIGVVHSLSASGIAWQQAHAMYAADEGLPGDGHPPSPGPTEPDGPSL